MKTIGLRATPTKIYFSIVEYEEDEATISVVDSVTVPMLLTEPDQLSYIRIMFYTFIQQFQVEAAVIRRREDIAQNFSPERTQIEGVLQELISSCSVSRYKACSIVQIASLLEKTASEIKQGMSGTDIMGIENWSSYSKEQRESILCALAATQLKGV